MQLFFKIYEKFRAHRLKKWQIIINLKQYLTIRYYFLKTNIGNTFSQGWIILSPAISSLVIEVELLIVLTPTKIKLRIRKFWLNIEINSEIYYTLPSFLEAHPFHIYFNFTAPQVMLISRSRHFMEFDFKHSWLRKKTAYISS